MRRIVGLMVVATAGALSGVIAGWFGLPRSLGVHRQSAVTENSAAVAPAPAPASTVTSTGRPPGSGRGGACCIAIVWRFWDDGEPTLKPQETVTFKLRIDDVEHPEFAQSVVVDKQSSVVELQFATMLPADMFFGHGLTGELNRAGWTNKECIPTLTHGFSPGRM